MNFEKLSFLKHKEDKNKNKSKKESIGWPKYMKYTALVALLMSSGLSVAQSLEGNRNQNEKSKSELVLEKSTQEVKKLCKLMLEDPSVKIGNFNQTKSREWESLNKKEIVKIGYQEDGATPKWIMYEDGSKLYIDYNGDGKVDRMVINNEITNPDNNKIDIDSQKAASEMDAFGSMEDLSENASISASMKPEKISVAQIIKDESGHLKLQVVEFDSGQHGEIEGQQATDIAQEMQADYLKSMESVVGQMTK